MSLRATTFGVAESWSKKYRMGLLTNGIQAVPPVWKAAQGTRLEACPDCVRST